MLKFLSTIIKTQRNTSNYTNTQCMLAIFVERSVKYILRHREDRGSFVLFLEGRDCMTWSLFGSQR